MIEATCLDHYCIKQNAVDEHGGSIICLPNKVVIEGENTAEDLDSERVRLKLMWGHKISGEYA